MCLALVALSVHPRFALVVAANRDEFHARAAAPAHWWSEGWLAGRDLAAGGTWLGVSATGRWAFLTNLREPGRHDPAAPSRGALVPAMLDEAAPLAERHRRIVDGSARRNGFNLVAGDAREAYWGSNRGPQCHALTVGIYGLSNATLDTPWPKVTRTKAGFGDWCRRGATAFDELFALLADRTLAPDDALPSTGVTLERERMLSAPFIVSADYGTRCTTVLAIDHHGEATFVERSFDATGAAVGEVDERFHIRPRSR